VFPTPVIGMLGILEDKKRMTGIAFTDEGDQIYLIGRSRNDIASSEYLYSYHQVKNSPAPYFDLDEEHELQQVLSELIHRGLIVSAHDVSDGGLFTTLFESARINGLGFTIDTDAEIRKDAFLFGEAQSRVVVTLKPGDEGNLAELLASSSLEFSLLGEVTGKNAVVDGEDFGSIDELNELYESVIPAMMDGDSVKVPAGDRQG